MNSDLKIIFCSGEAVFRGNTFFYKEDIKMLGGCWNPASKEWTIVLNHDVEEKIRTIFPFAEYLKENAENTRVVDEKIENLPYLSVAALNQKISQVLAGAFSGTQLVVGKIAKINRTAGRVYISLVDTEDGGISVDGVIWSGEEKVCADLLKAGFQLEKDLEVMFLVAIGLNNRRAQVSLSIKSIRADYTVQKHLAMREQTNRRLKKENLFGKNKDRKLPLLPIRLGVLTSKGGTVIHDFMNSLLEADFGFEVLWYPIQVQGNRAISDVIRGLGYLANNCELDAILLFRGGGSASELGIFNQYEIAKAICLCPIPVISAIGHQEDETSAQDVSCLSFGVPKDLGHFLAARVKNTRDCLKELAFKIYDDSLQNLQQRDNSFYRHCKTIEYNSENLFRLKDKDLEFMKTKFHERAGVLIRRRSDVLINIAKKIEQQSFLLSKYKGFHLRDKGLQFCHIVEVLLREEEKKLCNLQNLPMFAERSLKRKEKGLLDLQHIIDSSSPELQLSRGFALVKTLGGEHGGSYVLSAKSLQSLVCADVVFADGAVRVDVGEKNAKEKT